MSLAHVLIVHGWQGSGPEHWQTWLADSLRAQGHDVRYPQLPQCDTPCPDRWGAVLQDELSLLGHEGDRVVACHSLGCVLWLRQAGTIAPAHRVDRVLLVAPPCPGAAVEELADFYPTGAERKAVAAAAGRTLLVCSDDDPYCPGRGADRYWGEPLGLAVEVLAGAGHINAEAGFGPWPEAQQWLLGERDSLLPAAAGVRQG